MGGPNASSSESPDACRGPVADVEDEFVLGGTRYRFVRLSSAGATDAPASPSGDPTARALFAWCQDTPHGGETLDAILTPPVIAKLYRALAHRARELATRGLVPRDWADPGGLPWPTLLRSIVSCLAAGASAPAAHRGGIATRVLQLGTELRHIIDDNRSTPALALRMLRPDDRPRLCRHYAAVLPVIFAAVQRAAGRDPIFALDILGRPWFDTMTLHSWNWFVDVAHAQIVALDLHAALKFRTAEEDVFSTWLDWMKVNNVSGFLNALFFRAWHGRDVTVVRAALPQLIDPATRRGQSLLYRLAQQPAVHPQTRARIVDALERRGFAAAVPDWQRDIEHARASPLIRTLVRMNLVHGSDVQSPLLDAIGL